MQVNKYIRYFINSGTFLLVFAAALTLITVVLFSIKLYSINSTNKQFTPLFTAMMSLITLWIPMNSKKKEEIVPSDSSINPYVRYFVNTSVFVMLFSAVLTTIGIIFCAAKIISIEDDDPQFTIYLTAMMTLITLWIPIQYLKTKNILAI